MDRRSLIKNIAFVTGASIIGGELLMMHGCKASDSSAAALFKADELTMLDLVAQTILPPRPGQLGPKDIQAGSVIATLVKDCYRPEDQEIFKAGLADIISRAEQKHKLDFVKLDDVQRDSLLKEVDAERKTYQKNKKESDPDHYMTMMRQLSILSYFTHERVCKEVLNYIPVPGKFDGAYPYKKGDKMYAIG
jgi:hypothetical protein